MVKNKVLLSFDMNGNFLSLQEGSNKIYAGSVASVEYYVDFSENLSVNDLVYISFTGPDNQKLAPLICERILDNRFKLLSTGEELDYNLTTTEEMTINAIIKTRDIITNTSSIKSQASVVVNVYPGSQFVPGIVDGSVLTNLEEHLNDIEKYTIKKYDVKDIVDEIVLVPYSKDRIKEAPAVYIGYSSQVKYYDWGKEDYNTITVQGNLLVLSEENDNALKQYEYLFVDNEIYARTLTKPSNSENLTAGEFYSISLTNNTFLGYTQDKISSHNTDQLSHQDLRSLVESVEGITQQNTEDIENIQSSISSLTVQVNSNSNLINQTKTNLENNYYTKVQTYTKDEVNSLLGTAAGFQFVVVDELPVQGDPTKIYLVPVQQVTTLADNEEQAEVEDYYDEYIYLASEDRYECIGSTRINIDDYVTIEQYSQGMSAKADKTELTRLQILDEEV